MPFLCVVSFFSALSYSVSPTVCMCFVSLFSLCSGVFVCVSMAGSFSRTHCNLLRGNKWQHTTKLFKLFPLKLLHLFIRAFFMCVCASVCLLYVCSFPYSSVDVEWCWRVSLRNRVLKNDGKCVHNSKKAACFHRFLFPPLFFFLPWLHWKLERQTEITTINHVRQNNRVQAQFFLAKQQKRLEFFR